MARVEPGDEVIVLGAGGGVGLAAVQLGVQLGATVTAVASSTGKLYVAAHYGAHQVVNHRSADLRGALREALPGGADAVIDPVGGDLSEPALRSLRRGGRFVTVGFASGVIPESHSTWCSSRASTCSASSFRTSHPRNSSATRTNCAAPRQRPGAAARRRGLPAFRNRPSAKACRRRPRHRQGPHRSDLARRTCNHCEKSQEISQPAHVRRGKLAGRDQVCGDRGHHPAAEGLDMAGRRIVDHREGLGLECPCSRTSSLLPTRTVTSHPAITRSYTQPPANLTASSTVGATTSSRYLMSRSGAPIRGPATPRTP
jgi:Zinc-binding dehydrogenase